VKRFATHIPFLVLITAFFVQGAAAQQYESHLSADSVTVGDRFELTVVVGHDGTREPVFPHNLIPDSLQSTAYFTLGDFEILGVKGTGGRDWPTGGRIDSVIYEATTFALDTARVAGIPVGLALGGDTLQAMTPPAFLQIGSLVPEDATELQDLAELATFERSWWPWILGLLALAGVLYGLWRWRNQSEEEDQGELQSEPAIPPYQQALERLGSLQKEDLSDPDRIKPFYVELTDILRTYVGQRTHVPALETTTRELLLRLRTSASGTVLPDDVMKEIDQVLTHSDLVKFADLKPILEQTREMVDETRNVIEGTESAYREAEMRRERERRAALEAAQYAPAGVEEEDLESKPEEV
jgi:hypothetical protein